MQHLRRLFFAGGIGLAVGLIGLHKAQAHGGKVNALGCHKDKSTGEDHCHEPGAASQQRVRIVQSALKSLGYAIDDDDGHMGSATTNALAAFEQAKNLPASGKANDALIYQLVLALGANRNC